MTTLRSIRDPDLFVKVAIRGERLLGLQIIWLSAKLSQKAGPAAPPDPMQHQLQIPDLCIGMPKRIFYEN